MTARPSVGVGVLLRRDHKLLLLKRKRSHGAGSWTSPGGHLEYGETLEACATRETQEETGLVITSIRFMGVTNDVFPTEGLHYVTLWVEAQVASGSPTINPDEATEIGWFSQENLPHPLFLPLMNLLEGDLYSVI